MAVSDQITIRPAEPRDTELILDLIKELADYEQAPDQVRGDTRLLAQALFGEHPSAEALIAERDGTGIGFALFHGTFSTWECRPGIWLEDLFVPPEHRRGGVGGALLAAVAAIAVERGCTRLGWAALDWNALALDFYAKLGARQLNEWIMHRLDGAALEAVARAAPPIVSPVPGGDD